MKFGWVALGAAVLILAAWGCTKQPPARILPSKVTMANVETFEKQVISDLPVGTSKKDVEAYLTHEKILHSFVDATDPLDPNTFFGGIQNIGTRMGFEGSLQIRVRVNAQDKVDKVWFRIDYDAP